MQAEKTTILIPWFCKVFLIFVGLVVGIGLAGILVIFIRPKVGTQFSSLEDLRTTMSQHDERDVKADQSVSLRSLIEPNSSDRIIYQLRPNLNVKFQGVPVRTNSLGMRYPEIPIAKENGTIRVALLGDSFVFGWGVEEEQSFASLFEKNLGKSFPFGSRYEVLNFGVPGYSTFQEVTKYLEQDQKFSVDAVVIYFVDNDFGLPFFVNSGSSDNPLVASLQFAKKVWSSNEDAALQEKQRQLEAMVDPNRALMKLAKVLKDVGTPIFLVVNPGKDAEIIPSRLWALKKKPDIRLITLNEEVALEVEDRKIVKSDLKLPEDPHPSALKHEIIGRLMAQKIGPILLEDLKKKPS